MNEINEHIEELKLLIKLNGIDDKEILIQNLENLRGYLQKEFEAKDGKK